MNREIKFRAKDYSNNWVYGNLIHSKRFAGWANEWRIHEPETGIENVFDDICFPFCHTSTK